MYSDISKHNKNELYGRGFTLSGTLNANLRNVVSRGEVLNKIKSGFYQYVIFGSIRRCNLYLKEVIKYFKRYQIIFVDGEDETIIVQELVNKGIYFKRELLGAPSDVFPITFGIPKEKIVESVPRKFKARAHIIPGDISTYIFFKESEYYKDYQESKYAITSKKAGWDCLRHYEILANGCIPYFPYIEECPPNTLKGFPKEIIKKTNEIINSGEVGDLDVRPYIESLLSWTRIYLTTEKIVTNILHKSNCMKQEQYYAENRHEILQFIPQNIQKTLDVGCGIGNFSEAVRRLRNNESWGIEPVCEIAKIAAGKLDKVLNGSFDEVWTDLPKKYFDCIFFNDVLEHMFDPIDALLKVKENLMPSGYVVASIPNVRYMGNLIELLIKKDWEYTNSGILDNTHFRFFTKKSIIRMFSNCGFAIESIEGLNPLRSRKFSFLNTILLNNLEDARFLQFLVIARSSNSH